MYMQLWRCIYNAANLNQSDSPLHSSWYHHGGLWEIIRAAEISAQIWWKSETWCCLLTAVVLGVQYPNITSHYRYYIHFGYNPKTICTIIIYMYYIAKSIYICTYWQSDGRLYLIAIGERTAMTRERNIHCTSECRLCAPGDYDKDNW